MASGWIGGLVLAAAAAASGSEGDGSGHDVSGHDDGLERDDEAGVRGRSELAALVARCLEQQADPTADELEPQEGAFGLALSVVEARGLRVLATSGPEESRRAARSLGAARALFIELSGKEASYPPGLRAYLLATSEAKDAFLKQHPKLAPEARAALAKLEGSGVPGTADWAFWEGDEEKRLDGALRVAFNWLLRTPGVTLERHAWLHEGLGFYLTHAFTGTYLTWMVPLRPGRTQREAEDVALHAQMGEPGADWLALACGLFAAERKFELEELLHLELREFGPSDHLRAQALAAYLMEVHRGALGGVLTRVGAGEDPRAVLEESLGFPFAELRARLDGWLERREALIAKAEGRRSDAELEAQWRALDSAQKKVAVVAFERVLAGLETPQLRWLRALVANAPPDPPQAGVLPFFDPKVHAPAQPIARKRLASTDARVKRLLEEVRKEPDARAPVLAFDYDWGQARVVRCGDPAEPEAVFHNALLGLPPRADLARALVLATLDGPEASKGRKLQAAFSHAYTDRGGNVYPLSLFEMWATGETIEMPDVDTLGIVHDVLDQWNRWVAPVDGSQHDALYEVIGELFLACRRWRELRMALADLLLAPGMTPRPGYETQVLNLQALWAGHDSTPTELAKVLPDSAGFEAFLTELVERCKRDFRFYGQGRRRAALLRQDGVALRIALGVALEEAAAWRAEEPPATER